MPVIPIPIPEINPDSNYVLSEGIDCGEKNKENIEPGYRVVYPTESGVTPGNGTLVPLSGGALVKFIRKESSKLQESIEQSASSETSRIIEDLRSSIGQSSGLVTDLLDTYSSKYLKKRLKLQQALFKYKTTLPSYPKVSIGILKSQDGIWKEKDLSTFEHLQSIASDPTNVAEIDDVGSFKYLSPECILEILNLMIDETYFLNTSSGRNEYYPLIKSNSGISFFSLYLSLIKHMGRELENHKNYLEGQTEDAYLGGSDLFIYYNTSERRRKEWEEEGGNAPLDFIMQEIFGFFIPYYKVYNFGQQNTCGIYTIIDKKNGESDISIGYLKFPDLTFEDPDGDLDYSEINFGLKKSEDSNEYVNEEYLDKTFLTLKYNINSKASCDALRYLPAPKVNLTQEDDIFNYQNAKLDLNNNIAIEMDIKNIIGGEGRSFGLNEAPDFKDYFGRISICVPSAEYGSKSKFNFMDGGFSKEYRNTSVDLFSYPNNIGGIAIDEDFEIGLDNPKAILSNRFFPSGNFNIAMLEELSKNSTSNEDDIGKWNERYFEAIKKFHDSNIAPISKESYLTGSTSQFFKPSLADGKGLSSDIGSSLSSYRAYFMSNGIPNDLSFVSLFGFESLQDFFNFNGNISSLFIDHEFYDEDSDGAKLRSILEENKLIADQNGILLCRPRIADNSSNIIAEHLKAFSFSSLGISDNSSFPEDAEEFLVSVRSNNVKINDSLNFSNKRTYYNFYTIDRLGQFRRSSVQLSIPQINDFSTLKIEGDQFAEEGLDVTQPFSVKFSTNEPGEFDQNQEVLVSFYSDKELTGLIGSSVMTATVSGPGQLIVSSQNSLQDDIGISPDTEGLLFFSVENSYSASPPAQAPIGTTAQNLELEYDEFKFVGKTPKKIPISISGDAARISLKSKNSRFDSDSSLLMFYYAAEVSGAAEEKACIEEFRKFSFYEDIKVIKIIDEEGSEKRLITSKVLRTRLSRVKASIFGLKPGRFGEVQFPPENLKFKNITGLKNIKNAGILVTAITLESEDIKIDVSQESFLEAEYSDDDVKNIESGTLNSNFSYMPFDAEPFASTPDIIEMAITDGDGTKITSNEVTILSQADKINSGFDFGNSESSSNLNKRKSISILVAIKGVGYKKRDIDFLFQTDRRLKKIKQSFLSRKERKQEVQGNTVFRLNGVSVEKDISEVNLVVALKSRKYMSTFLSSEIFSYTSNLEEEDFILDEDGFLSPIGSIDILFGDEEKALGVVSEDKKEIVFNKTGRYSLESDVELSATTGSGDRIRYIKIGSGSPSFPLEEIDIPQPGSFPPSIPQIVDVITPDVSLEVEVNAETGEASVSLGITNPLEIFISGSILNGIADIPQRVLDGINASYVGSKYLENVSDLNIEAFSLINSNYFYLNSDKTKAMVFSNISSRGKGVIEFGNPRLVSAKVGDVAISKEDLSNLNLSENVGKEIVLVFDGKVGEETTFSVGGYDLPVIIDKNEVSLAINEDTIEEIRVSSGIIDLGMPLFVSSDPCKALIGDKQDSSKKQTGADLRKYSEGFSDKLEDIVGAATDKVDPEKLFEKLDFMELGYGNTKIRKPVAATKEFLRSICDLSFHMTAEFRASLRGFQNLLVVIKVIFCIIDVICALGNPVKLGPAIIKLFLCLFDLLLLLPQLAIPIALLKLLSHTFELLACVLIKIIKTYVAFLEIARALDEAYRLQDYESLVRLEKVLNRHVLTIEADISVLDPILDILELFQELLALTFSFPCNSSDGGDLFGVCGASDNVVCDIILGKLYEGNSINVSSLIPFSQSYTTLPIQNLTTEISTNSPTLNCGNTPPDGLADQSINSERAEQCFGSDNPDLIFVEPRYYNDSNKIIGVDLLDVEEVEEGVTVLNGYVEDNINFESLRLGESIESTYKVSATQIKKNNIFDGSIINGDTRECIFEFNYNGRTNSLAFNKFIHWIFRKVTIDENQTSDSPIIPLKKDGDGFYLDKTYSDGIRLWNPSTMEGYDLEGNVSDGFEIPKYKLKYDVNGKEFVDQDHRLPQVVIVDERSHVYKIDKIYVDEDEDSKKFGIYKIKAKRVDYPSFSSLKFSKEEEQYIADPKIYYANENFLKIKSLLEIRTDELKDDGNGNEVATEDSIANMESAIWLFDEAGVTLYLNFKIIPLGSAIFSKNISDEPDHIISKRGTGNFNFIGGAIFEQVYIQLSSLASNVPLWAQQTHGDPDFEAKKSEFIAAFEEGGGLYENYGSFPYTEYIHNGETFRDPTQAYLDAFSKSIGDASYYDFPSIYFFDMSSIAEELKTVCENNSAMNNLVDNDPGEISDIVSEAFDCINKIKTSQISKLASIKETIESRRSLTELPFIANPYASASEIAEAQECISGIMENSLCDYVINPLATEFLVLEDEDSTPNSPFIPVNNEILGSEGQGIGSISLTGATKYANGIGDNGEFFVNEEIAIRVIPRLDDDSLLPDGNYDHSKVLNLNIISDSGGKAVILKKFEKVYFNTEDQNGNIVPSYGYDAIIKSSVKSEIEVTCNICDKVIAAQIPASVAKAFQIQGSEIGCNDSGITAESVLAFAQTTQTPRVLSIVVIDESENLAKKSQESGFDSKANPSTFGSQE